MKHVIVCKFHLEAKIHCLELNIGMKKKKKKKKRTFADFILSVAARFD